MYNKTLQYLALGIALGIASDDEVLYLKLVFPKLVRLKSSVASSSADINNLKKFHSRCRINILAFSILGKLPKFFLKKTCSKN